MPPARSHSSGRLRFSHASYGTCISGETEPPTWPVKVETTLTGEPTPQVYEQYVRWRG